MSYNAFKEFKDAYAGMPTEADRLTEKLATSLLSAYTNAHSKIIVYLHKYGAVTSYSGFAKKSALLEQIGDECSKLSGEMGKILKESLAAAAVDATEVAAAALRLSGDDLKKAKEWHIAYNKDYAEQTFLDNFAHVAGQTDKMAADVKNMLRIETAKVMREAAIEGLTRKAATKKLKDAIIALDPDFTFVDKAGRNWKTQTYFEMLGRTLMGNLHRECYVNTLANEGKDLVKVSRHAAKDACSKWEGKVLSITGVTKGVPTLQEAIGSGEVFHPRCRHRLVAYDPKMDDIFDAIDKGTYEHPDVDGFLATLDAKKAAADKVAREASKLAKAQAALDAETGTITFTKNFKGANLHLNGVPFDDFAPASDYWATVADVDVGEPAMTPTKKVSTGVIVEEPDGRIWVYEPKDHFGGYEHTFPKGGWDTGLTLQQNALKEVYEETGLKVEITGYVGDFEKTTSTTRYYRGKRIGGNPANAGWEAENVKLATPEDLKAGMLNKEIDQKILDTFLNPPPDATLVEKVKQSVEKFVFGRYVSQEEFDLAKTLPPKLLKEIEVEAQKKYDDLQALKKQAALKAEAKAKKEAEALLAKEAAEAKVTASDYPADYFDWDNLEQIGPQKGSNEGALFRHKVTGEKFYIKVPKSAEHAMSEYVAAEIYRLAGVEAPETHLLKWKDGRTAIASKWKDGLKAVNIHDAAELAKFYEGFGIDALLGNWDVAGATFDNIAITAEGKAFRLDAGGSLFYRAQGKLKGTDGTPIFGNKVLEIDSLRNPGINSKTALIFGNMPEAALIKAMKRAEAVDLNAVEALLKKSGMDDYEAYKLIKVLEARQKDIARQRRALMRKAKAAKEAVVQRRSWWGFDAPTQTDAEYVRKHHSYSYYAARPSVKVLVRQYGLTEEEAVALIMYTNGSYETLNSRLRSGETAWHGWVAGHTKVINSALEKIGKKQGFYTGTVKRGIELHGGDLDKFAAKWHVGAVDIGEDFWSTSANNRAFSTNVRIHIKSKTGVLIQKFSEHPTEGEVLFRSGTMYRCYKVEGNTYYLEEV